jgi:hypothetical protein
MPGPSRELHEFEREVLLVPRVAPGQGSFEERTGRLRWRTLRYPHHDAFTQRSAGFALLLFFFVVLNVMDAVTTLYGTARLGWGAEANPVLRAIGARFGGPGFIFYKAVGCAVVVMGLFLMHRGFSRAVAAARSRRPFQTYARWQIGVEFTGLALVLVFTYVVINNLVLIATMA